MKLAVGTVQFGQAYGVSNADGKTSPEEVERIFEVMHGNGVDLMDTAPAYGDSESVIGKFLDRPDAPKIVTKTVPIRKSAISSEDVQRVRNGFTRSLHNLRVADVYGLLVHHVEDLLVPGGESLFDFLRALRNDGLVRKIGVSVYDAGQIDAITNRFDDVDIVQAPVSIVDQRLVASGHLSGMKLAGIEIHARSIFLQGLLLMSPGQVPQGLQGIRRLLTELGRYATGQGLTITHYALQFVKSLDTVDRMIIGVNDSRQLLANISAYQAPLPSIPDYAMFACSDASILNPAAWKLH